MKWQVLMVALATVIALFLGAERWHARITANSAFSRNASAGHWTLVYADQEGVKTVHEGSWSAESLRGFEKLPKYGTGGFDVSADFERMAYVDQSNYSVPALKVVTAHHFDRPIAQVTTTTGVQVQCPLFDTDGSVLFLQSGSGRGWEMQRLRVPAPKNATSHDVPWPSAIDPNDCPERSDDGSTFAWLGTDGAIHVAKRDAAGNFSGEQKISGVEFELSHDGSFLVGFDGTSLSRIDTSSMSRSTIASNIKGNRTIAISPDDTWVIASSTGSYGSGGWSAFRLSDGSQVPIAIPGGNAYYFGYDNRRKMWVSKSP